jgi:hypothetical protein
MCGLLPYAVAVVWFFYTARELGVECVPARQSSVPSTDLLVSTSTTIKQPYVSIGSFLLSRPCAFNLLFLIQLWRLVSIRIGVL